MSTTNRLSAVLAAGWDRAGPAASAVVAAKPLDENDLNVNMYYNQTTFPSFYGSITNIRANKKLLKVFSLEDVSFGTPSETFRRNTPEDVKVVWRDDATLEEREEVKLYVRRFQQKEVRTLIALLYTHYRSTYHQYIDMIRSAMDENRYFDLTMELYKRMPSDTPWTLPGVGGEFGEFPPKEEFKNGVVTRRPYTIDEVHRTKVGYTLMIEGLRRSLGVFACV